MPWAAIHDAKLEISSSQLNMCPTTSPQYATAMLRYMVVGSAAAASATLMPMTS